MSERLKELLDEDRVRMIRAQAEREARERLERIRDERRADIGLAMRPRRTRHKTFEWMPLVAGLVFVVSIVLTTTGAVTWFRWIAAALR